MEFESRYLNLFWHKIEARKNLACTDGNMRKYAGSFKVRSFNERQNFSFISYWFT